MAETNIWNISSTDDPELHYVTRNDPDDGNYIFTPPESGQIAYKITYTNGSATGETIYVVKSTDCYVDPCQNNLNGPTVTFTSPEGATAKTVGSAASSVTVTYDLGECWKFISASRYGEPNNITSFRDSDGKIIYYAANNTTDKVQSDAIYKFRNYAANVTASSYVRIIQESKCASESAPTLSPLSITDVPITGETYRNKIEFDVTECWYLKSAVTGENWVNLSDDYHTVVVSKNDTLSERSTDIVYTFENTEDSAKTTAYTVNVNQLADVCSCNLVTYEPPTDRTIDSYDYSEESVQITLGEFTSLCAAEFSETKMLVAEVISGVTYLDNYPEAPSGMPAKYSKLYWDVGMEDETPVFAKIKPNREPHVRNIKFRFVFVDPNNNWAVLEECQGTYEFTQIEGFNCERDFEFEPTGDYRLSTQNYNNYPLGVLRKLPDDVNVNIVVNNPDLNFVNLQSLTQGDTLFAKIEETNTPRILTFYFEINGHKCGDEYEIYQEAWRGTDNGNSLFLLNGETVTESHPVLFCSDISQSRHDSDSLITDGVCFINPDNNTEIELNREIDNIYTYKDSNNVDWLQVNCITGGCVTEGYSIELIALSNNDTNQTREAVIKLKVKDSISNPVVKSSSICACDTCTLHQGEPVIREWDYPVYQAPVGKIWCKFCDDKDRTTVLVDDNASIADKKSICKSARQDLCEKCNCEIIDDKNYRPGYKKLSSEC